MWLLRASIQTLLTSRELHEDKMYSIRFNPHASYPSLPVPASSVLVHSPSPQSFCSSSQRNIYIVHPSQFSQIIHVPRNSSLYCENFRHLWTVRISRINAKSIRYVSVHIAVTTSPAIFPQSDLKVHSILSCHLEILDHENILHNFIRLSADQAYIHTYHTYTQI